jgi:hypothetical protein
VVVAHALHPKLVSFGWLKG